MSFGENSKELKEQPKKIFVVGFFSSAEFPLGGQVYTTGDSIKQQEGVILVELDEMYLYLGKKKTTDGCG